MGALNPSLRKALGLNGRPDDQKATEEPDRPLVAFLGFNPAPGKIEQVAGELKIELVGSMWKVQVISHMLWMKKTFFTEDLSKLVMDCETALQDGKLPFEQYRSQKQKKDPERVGKEKA